LRLFIFGYGYVAGALSRRLTAKGWTVAASVRDPADAARLAADTGGCPGLQALVPALALARAFPDWTGYLSTTGVYGDRHGGWVFEASRLSAQSVEGARRVGAERDWLEVGRGMGLTVAIFRLPGIYGPGRSAFDRLRAGEARRIVSPGQVFSRIHVDDLAAGLEASMARPRAAGIYNLCDDEPAANSDVVAYAAQLLGRTPPPEVALADAKLSPAALRFYAENKRVSNARAKSELGWWPAYPTYREGLRAVLEAGG
jgi:nucleoside-diphosphate-sugar epimerase